MSQSGWVIERHINSELRYWTGRGIGPEQFVTKHDEAIRFARETDASVVLSWLLDGNGRVAEHEWSDSKEVEAEQIKKDARKAFMQIYDDLAQGD